MPRRGLCQWTARPGGTHKPAFIAWCWAPLRDLPALAVPFKRETYERVVREFGKFAGG
jgi:putative (di)nucleoside polyphosphate hydrolase